MRTSQFFFTTLKEAPADAEVMSQKMMLRAGYIKRTAAGIYTWMPLGLRVLRKVENIVREEMNAAGALELLMPAVQPFELWQESGRGPAYGPELLRFKDRHQRDFVIGPTHEEVVTDIVRRDVKSYRQLPIHLYQIQTKFRDEIRPRFGVMRGREFLMKDAYSFDVDQKGLDAHYLKMEKAYRAIFERCGLEYALVQADSGAIGGSASEEFMVVADTGEDALVFSEDGKYGANVEKAVTAPLPEPWANEEEKPFGRADSPTPGIVSTEGQAKHLGTTEDRITNTMLYEAIRADDSSFVCAIVIRGDLTINEVKLPKALGVAHVRLVPEEWLPEIAGCKPGFIGPIGLSPRAGQDEVPVYVDRSMENARNVWCGANQDGTHHSNLSVKRDLKVAGVLEVATARDGDPSPTLTGVLRIKRGIEVGHIFKLGTKYSEAMKCEVADPQQKMVPLQMGCYGLGVGRTVAAAVEQNHDDDGIIWPVPLAPFQVALLSLQRDAEVLEAAEKLYAELTEAGVEVFWDDRDERPGVKFKDADLIGFPVRVVVGGKALAKGVVEVSTRREKKAEGVSPARLVDVVKATLAAGARTLAL